MDIELLFQQKKKQTNKTKQKNKKKAQKTVICKLHIQKGNKDVHKSNL